MPPPQVYHGYAPLAITTDALQREGEARMLSLVSLVAVVLLVGTMSYLIARAISGWCSRL